MNDAILSLLGLCRRAGKLTIGNDAVVEDTKNGTAKLVILTRDISANTRKKLTKELGEVTILTLNRAKEELGFALGRRLAAVVAVCDDGFAAKLTTLIESDTGGNCL